MPVPRHHDRERPPDDEEDQRTQLKDAIHNPIGNTGGSRGEHARNEWLDQGSEAIFEGTNCWDPAMARQSLMRKLKEQNSIPLQAGDERVCIAPLLTAVHANQSIHQLPTLTSRAFSPRDDSLTDNQDILVASPSGAIRPNGNDPSEVQLASPADIERPRSALHSGDFREGLENAHTSTPRPSVMRSSVGTLSTSPPVPWLGLDRNNSVLSSTLSLGRRNGAATSPPDLSTARGRAPSLSTQYSSLVLKAPTSPLVQQANNTELDFSPIDDFSDLVACRNGANRRRTVFGGFHGTQTSPPTPPSLPTAHSMSAMGRGTSFDHRNHRARRSISSLYSLQPASSPQTPFLSRSRRPSYSTDTPHQLHHASLVGSYEESILRGRMSTTPSKPLDFTAQIGVLGKGNCKPSLRCPGHVQVQFPAYFYSYPTVGGRSLSDDSPSPYVGTIDLEHHLKPEDSKSRRRRNNSPSSTSRIGASRDIETKPERDRDKRKRTRQNFRAPPGGCYRIPQQGQLQIVIKNPNKTAVKLFLIPYDLEGMESGTKTFIRQRSYSAGPIIDMPVSSRINIGTDRPEASLSTSEDPNDRPILRYLIHVNICCPSKGRYYLYSLMRVVFANRVPDGKEKLRNEVQFPEPRYSPWKPSKDSSQGGTIGSAGAKLAAEKAMRRRSAGVTPTFGGQVFDMPKSYSMAATPQPILEYTRNNIVTQDLGWTTRSNSRTPLMFSTSPVSPTDNDGLTNRFFALPPPLIRQDISSHGHGPSLGFDRRTVDSASGGSSSSSQGLLTQRLQDLNADVEMSDAQDVDE